MTFQKAADKDVTRDKEKMEKLERRLQEVIFSAIAYWQLQIKTFWNEIHSNTFNMKLDCREPSRRPCSYLSSSQGICEDVQLFPVVLLLRTHRPHQHRAEKRTERWRKQKTAHLENGIYELFWVQFFEAVSSLKRWISPEYPASLCIHWTNRNNFFQCKKGHLCIQQHNYSVCVKFVKFKNESQEEFSMNIVFLFCAI